MSRTLTASTPVGSSRGRAHRRLAGALALGLVPALVAAVHSGPATAGPAAEPALSLRRAAASVELTSYRNRVELDLGAYVVAGAEPFEVRVTRPAVAPYRHPVTGTLIRESGNVVLPDGMVDDFDGLRDFTTTRIRDRDGTLVAERTSDFCVSYGAVRVDPDAVDRFRYPNSSCYTDNPFTLGSVHGVEAGWGVPASEPYRSRVRLEPGRYTATVRITAAYRRLLALPRAAAMTSIEMRVLRRGEGCEDCRTEPAPDSPIASSGPVPLQPAAQEPVGTSAAPPAAALPDLRSVPAWNIGVRNGRMIFGATVWNAGPSPLVVDGFRRADEDVMDAYQYFYDADGTAYGHQRTGTMEWDVRDGHRHWHFKDFARYRLLDADKQSVVRSKKESFCLANTDAIDYTVPGANWDPEGTDLHTACGSQSSLGIREVLDAGSGDTYLQYRPGQSFNLDGLAPGIYFIEVTGNPAGRLAESDATNNTALRKVRITGGANSDSRDVQVFDVGLVHTR